MNLTVINIEDLKKPEFIEAIAEAVAEKRREGFPDVMTQAQVCEYLKTSPATVVGLAKRGLPVSYAIGEKSPRYIKTEIDKWLAGRL